MGDIEVPAGVVLIIEPGVMVKIYSELSFKVYGQLLAEGSESDSIFFIPVSEYWKGLQFYNNQDTCKLRFCSIKNFINRSFITTYSQKGGAIYGNNTKLVVKNCTLLNIRLINDNISFYNGYNAYGGAICIENSSMIMEESKIANNNIIGYYQFIGAGGAIYCTGGNVLIKQNYIANNYVKIDWLYTNCLIYNICNGGGIFTDNNCYIEKNIIKNNYCFCAAYSQGINEICFGDAASNSSGGGIYGGNIFNNVIDFNYCKAESSAGGWVSFEMAESKGGGVYGAIQLENNLIINNNCSASGIDNTVGDGYREALGGGIYGGVAKNNTIVNNSVSALSNGTIVQSGSGAYSSSVLSNCIIFFNEGANQVENCSVNYSCIQDGYAGQGNISSNPFFISGPQGNYYLKQYPCQGQQSPCVDSGDPSITLFPGTTRTDEYPDTGIIDMGFHYLFRSNFAAKFSTD